MALQVAGPGLQGEMRSPRGPLRGWPFLSLLSYQRCSGHTFSAGFPGCRAHNWAWLRGRLCNYAHFTGEHVEAQRRDRAVLHSWLRAGIWASAPCCIASPARVSAHTRGAAPSALPAPALAFVCECPVHTTDGSNPRPHCLASILMRIPQGFSPPATSPGHAHKDCNCRLVLVITAQFPKPPPRGGLRKPSAFSWLRRLRGNRCPQPDISRPSSS